METAIQMSVFSGVEKPLGDLILAKVLSEYAKITKPLKSGVPITRSNGVKEWTILASIVAISGENDENIRVLTLTSGVKLVPEQKLHLANGCLLHDLHAEVLSLRAFNRILLKEIQNVKKLESSSILTADLKFRADLKFLMYISDVPCGDLSMEQIVEQAGESSSAWKRNREGELLRGRAHFNQVGKIRTKPGRTDSLVSLSKSCSDKLCSRQYYGYCNAMTLYLLKENFQLHCLVLPQSKVKLESLQRCFHHRYQGKFKGPFLKVLPTAEVYKYEKSSAESKPSDLGLVLFREDGKWQLEVVGKNGLPNGRSKVGLKDASKISNAKLVDLFKDLIPPEIKKYSDFKSLNKNRQELKKEIRHGILQDEWISNYRDDFDIV